MPQIRYDFENYRDKAIRYVNEHGISTAIYKLTHNIPLSSGDYNELERVLTSELGNREDYLREYGGTPFGLLVRKITKVDHDAAMQAFLAFLNDESLKLSTTLLSLLNCQLHMKPEAVAHNRVAASGC